MLSPWFYPAYRRTTEELTEYLSDPVHVVVDRSLEACLESFVFKLTGHMMNRLNLTAS